jgi:hypothetical protein
LQAFFGRPVNFNFMPLQACHNASVGRRIFVANLLERVEALAAALAVRFLEGVGQGCQECRRQSIAGALLLGAAGLSALKRVAGLGFGLPLGILLSANWKRRAAAYHRLGATESVAACRAQPAEGG